MINFSVFDEPIHPIGYGGWNIQPVELIPLDLGPIDGGMPIQPIENVPPVDVPPANLPVPNVGSAGNPVGTVPGSAPVTGTTPAGPADAPVILPPGIDPTLLLIGGAVLLAVLILK